VLLVFSRDIPEQRPSSAALPVPVIHSKTHTQPYIVSKSMAPDHPTHPKARVAGGRRVPRAKRSPRMRHATEEAKACTADTSSPLTKMNPSPDVVPATNDEIREQEQEQMKEHRRFPMPPSVYGNRNARQAKHVGHKHHGSNAVGAQYASRGLQRPQNIGANGWA